MMMRIKIIVEENLLITYKFYWKLYHLRRKLSCYLFNYILQQQQKTFQIGIHEFQSKSFYSNLSLALAKFVWLMNNWCWIMLWCINLLLLTLMSIPLLLYHRGIVTMNPLQGVKKTMINFQWVYICATFVLTGFSVCVCKL